MIIVFSIVVIVDLWLIEFIPNFIQHPTLLDHNSSSQYIFHLQKSSEKTRISMSRCIMFWN
jgi:hypothetical protein